MAKTVIGRQVRMFRCHIAPLINGTQKVLNAFMPRDLGWKAEIAEGGSGVIVTNQHGADYFVPFTNIQTIELYPEEQAIAYDPPKKLGRPRSEAV